MGENDQKTTFASVEQKVVIVTGAASGIGEAIARIYAQNGMKVVCADRDDVQGQKVADQICQDGGEAIFMQTDCSDVAQVKQTIDAAVSHFGRLDGMVNNAGIGQEAARCMSMN